MAMPENRKVDASRVFPDLVNPTIIVNPGQKQAVLWFTMHGMEDKELAAKIEPDNFYDLLDRVRRAQAS